METENKYRKDTTEDHPLFNGDPTEYFLGQNWRKSVPKTCGPRGYWFKVTFTGTVFDEWVEMGGPRDGWVWIDG